MSENAIFKTKEANSKEPSKVFLSYSRSDSEFANQLSLALESRGFVTLVDRHDIDVAESWQHRLHELIQAADSVVFILTDDAISSEICAWEIGLAEKLSKRIVPVVPKALSGDIVPPGSIERLNYIHCWSDPAIPGSGIYSGLAELERRSRLILNGYDAEVACRIALLNGRQPMRS